MASKREKLKRAEDNARAAYDKKIKKLIPFGYIAAGAAVLALILCFCSFMYIHNNGEYYNNGSAFVLRSTKVAGSVEHSESGWSFFVAFLTGDYTNGDMGVPFNWFAENYVSAIGACTFFAMLLAIAAIFLSAFSAIRSKPVFGMISAGCSLLSGILFVVSFVLPTSKGVHTLIVGDYYGAAYCQGNPDCAVKSLAILPALVMLGACAVSVYAAVNFIKIKKEFKER